MPPLRIAGFGGELPVLDATALPDSAASLTDNCDVGDGVLKAVRTLRLVQDFGTALTYRRVFKLRKVGTDDELLLPSEEALSDVVRSPLVEDSNFRFYRTEPTTGGPNMTVASYDDIAADASTAFHPITVPAPAAAMTATPASVPAGSDVAETRVYLCLWQTSWGEESAPSPTATVTVKVGESVTLSSIPQPNPADLSGRTWDKVNIYRTVIGTGGAAFYFVDSVDVGVTSYVDSEPSSLVVYSRQLEAFQNENPPDGLLGLTVHHTGALCGFVGNDVYFSKPYLPHAWPTGFKISLAHEVRGLAAVGQELFVLTDSRPAIIYGSTVDALGVRYVNTAEPCVNKTSIVAYGAGVVYAGQYGLTYFTPDGARNITERIIDRQTWEDDFLTAGNIYGARYGNVYLGRSVGQLAFGFDLSGQGGLLRYSAPVDAEVTAFVKDLHGSTVYAIVGDAVYEWDAPNQPASEFEWRSKTFTLPAPTNFGAFQVHYREDTLAGGDTLFLEITIWGDDRVAFSGNLRGSGEVHRMAAGWKADQWKVQFRGNVIVTAFVMAETPRELTSA